MNAILENLRNDISKCAASVPCLFVTLGILNGSLFLVLKPDAPGILAGLVPVFACIAVSLVLSYRDVLLKFVLPTFAGLVSMLLNLHMLASDPCVEIIGRDSAGAVISAYIDDPTLCGPEIEWMPNPKNVTCRLERLKFTEPDTFRPAESRIILKLPAESPKLSYGDRIKASGYFTQPEDSDFEGSFDYKSYLSRKGVNYIFRADEMSVESSNPSFMKSILSVRNIIIARVCAGLSSDQNRFLAASLLFSCRQGMTWQTNQEFIRSGTIHVLSVSGLHIGIVASILLLMLSFIPFRMRCLVVPPQTALYALSTGMQIPAFRALCMVSVFLFLRAFLCSVSVINTLFLAAALVLVWNPMQIQDIGFQYSFLVTAFLILPMTFIGSWKALMTEKLRWIPSRLISPWLRFRTWMWGAAFAAVAACVVSWLSSVSITLFNQGIYVPYSIAANILLIPVTWLCFVFFTLGVFASLIYPPLASSPLIAFPIDICLSGISSLCSFFASQNVASTTIPPLWSILIFTFVLLVLFKTGNRRIQAGAAAVLALMLIAWGFASNFKNDEIMICSGGSSQVPMIIVSRPENDYSLVVNVPSYESASDAAAYLRSRGHSKISRIFVMSPKAEYCAGLKYLCAFMKAESLAMPEPISVMKKANEALKCAESSRIVYEPMFKVSRSEYTFSSPDMKSSVKNDDLLLEYSYFQSKISIRISDLPEGGAGIFLENNSGSKPLELRLERSLRKNIIFVESDGKGCRLKK